MARTKRFFNVKQQLYFRTSKIFLLAFLGIALGAFTHCASPAAQIVTPTAMLAPSVPPKTFEPTLEISPTRIMPPTTLTRNNNSNAAQLVSALELAANEMRAAENATTLEQAKFHAEAVVNILVGKYGRWYGDQNGDNQVTDPSDKRGVLPGEKIPVSGGADIDTNNQFPFGLVLLASGTQSSSPALENILGDVKLWRARARDGYDTIENALAQNNLATLRGTVPRSVAYARLILTSTQSLEQAQQLATDGVSELDGALQAARTLAQ